MARSQSLRDVRREPHKQRDVALEGLGYMLLALEEGATR